MENLNLVDHDKLNLKMDSKPVDLSAVMKEFNAWDEYATGVLLENKLLENQVELTHKDIEAAKERENYLLKELKSSRELVGALQTTLTKRCDLEDENVNLRKEIKTKCEKIDALFKENKTRISSMEQRIEELKISHTEQMGEMKSAMQHSASEERASLLSKIDEQSSDISNYKKQLVDKEKENQSALMKLRLEYDTKMMMLQKQTAKMQQSTSQMSSSNQDIFRKKLQHAKSEAEHEVSTLKRTISELQGKLDSQAQRLNMSNSGGLSLAKRKRY